MLCGILFGTTTFFGIEGEAMAGRLPRALRWLIGIGLALTALAIGGFVWLVFLGGVALSDRTMIWR
ncbi:MAG: hypothetical protein ACO32S_07945, partial [Steroidobacteraceae bacterium]